LLQNQIVTENVTADGQGVDLDDNEYITIQFSTEQTIDSVVILSNSNIESYSISYKKSNGDVYTLQEVNIKFSFCFFFKLIINLYLN
jgi:hypothetical protein